MKTKTKKTSKKHDYIKARDSKEYDMLLLDYIKTEFEKEAIDEKR